ncbi:acyltransferase family protein [Paenibacillus humicola]|uniref:acyltransferase family protein n=1 Tax=Paenibacillus humicola TaxID=3110540 RepID=UPI00237B318F|nr:acyltransferase family protein [Paenibacillus humicola]
MITTVKSTPIRPASSQKEGRLLYIDNLKAALTMLVVLHHLVYFSIGYGIFAPSSLEYGIGNIFLAVNQSFFMGLFFLISGYFVPSSFERNGAGRFIKDRIFRLLVPWIIYVYLLSPVQSIGTYVLDRKPFSWQTYSSLFTYGPMWYVGLLLIFACFYAVGARLMNKRVRPEIRPGTPPTYTMITVFAIVLTAAAFIMRLWVPELGLPGGSPKVESIVIFFTPSGYDLTQYVGFFIIGIIAYRRNWFRAIPDAMGRAGFGIAAGATILFLPLALIFGLNGYRFSGGWNWTSLVYSLWGSLFCIGISLGLITLFRKRFFRQDRGWGFLSAHAFTIYIIHIPLIAIVIVTLEVLRVSHAFIFPVTVVATIPLCFLLAKFIRKIPYSSKVL